MTFFQFMNKNVHISAVHIAFFRSITEEGWQIRIVSSANGLFIYIETSAHSEPFGRSFSTSCKIVLYARKL